VANIDWHDFSSLGMPVATLQDTPSSLIAKQWKSAQKHELFDVYAGDSADAACEPGPAKTPNCPTEEVHISPSSRGTSEKEKERKISNMKGKCDS
jgi:hypothetical protein